MMNWQKASVARIRQNQDKDQGSKRGRGPGRSSEGRSRGPGSPHSAALFPRGRPGEPPSHAYLELTQYGWWGAEAAALLMTGGWNTPSPTLSAQPKDLHVQTDMPQACPTGSEECTVTSIFQTTASAHTTENSTTDLTICKFTSTFLPPNQIPIVQPELLLSKQFFMTASRSCIILLYFRKEEKEEKYTIQGKGERATQEEN